MGTNEIVIRNGRIVRHDRIVGGDLVVRDGAIAHIGTRPGEQNGEVEIDAKGCYVMPGFVDLHVHGGRGFDLTAGRFDPERKTFDDDEKHYHEMLPEVARHFARHGVTFAPLATVASPEAKLRRVLGLLADYVESDRNGKDGCHLGGAFIEGTFIKDERFAGAQNPENFQTPSVDLFKRLNEAARGHIRYVNVAPEFGPDAMTLIHHLDEHGVLVGAGHTACTADQYDEAIRNGLRTAVHLTNGPTGSSFKPFGGGGALQAALTSRKVFAELIVDGYHIYSGYVCDIIERKGPYRICLITDAMFATEAEGIADFEVEGIGGCLSDNGKFLRVVGTENTLFGSVLTMDLGFCNVVNWLTSEHPGVWTEGHPSLDTEGAVLAASRFASANPARALHLYEPESTPFGRDLNGCFGSLMVGKRADIVVMRLDGEPGAFEAKVQDVLVGGERISIADA